MGPCPVCQATDVHASHRRSWLERVPFSWCGVLPYRCGRCQTRFYRLAWRDQRRRYPSLEDPAVDEIRAPRWTSQASALVTVTPSAGSHLPLTGQTENLSVRGARVRLLSELPAGTPVRLSIEGERPVRWSKAMDPGEFSHGVEFERSLGRKPRASRPLRQLRRRRRLRRVLIGLVTVALISSTAAGLVWLMETFRNYSPTYYEPKDIERERYEMLRRSPGPTSEPQHQ